MPRKSRARLVEQREAARHRVLYPAYVHFMRRRFKCRLVEISGYGCCVAGGPALLPGTPIMVESLLFGQRGAVVAHRAGGKLGLALLGPPLNIRNGADGDIAQRDLIDDE